MRYLDIIFLILTQKRPLISEKLFFIEEQLIAKTFVSSKYSAIPITECILKCKSVTFCMKAGFRYNNGDTNFVDCYLLSNQSSSLGTDVLNLKLLVEKVNFHFILCDKSKERLVLVLQAMDLSKQTYR